MATYTVMTGAGGELSGGLSLDGARRAAQEHADERGETVYVAGPGLHTDGAERGSDEDIGEAVHPDGVDTVRSYDSGDALPGAPSKELVRASLDVDTGAVPAFRDGNGVWQYVRPDEVEHYRRALREDVVTVYCE